MKLTIGVTGHRNLVAAEVPALREQVRAFFEALAREYPGLELQVITPLAEGADRLVAQVARELGIPLVVPLPMPRAEYERDFSGTASVHEFRDLIEGAEVLSLPLAGDTAGAVGRNHLYAQLGVFISNHCQILLALWDGKPGDESGGTADVVRYHLTAVMPGFSAGEESPNLLAENENDLAYHIVCSRDRPDGGPQAGLEELHGYWLTAHFGRQQGPRMPEDYHLTMLRLQAFAADDDTYRKLLGASARSLLAGEPPLAEPAGVRYVNRLFGVADWLAIHFQRRVYLNMLTTHVVAIFMGLTFILYSEFGGPHWLVYLFLSLFLTGFAVYLVGDRREWHRKYLDYRALAEGLRVQLYWNLAGVVETETPEFAYDNFLQKQDVDLGWIRHIMRSASLYRDRTRAPDPAWVDWVADHWVGQADGKTGQLGYYTEKSILKTRNLQRTARFGSLSLWGGILIAGVLALMAGRIGPDERHLLMILMGVLPLIAGVRDAFSHKRAEKELIKQYRFMGKIFTNARRLLDGSTDTAFRRRVLRALGNAALEEHAEWILMHRERPLEHSGL
ncbi:MAG: hypothetical protein GTN86_12045 [Xanthomonadales bacterium]|nr:hypothetical protein [Xanthomonadales bacterium]NIN60446.1 hypothetical protein [Xanthomonadales bacterium]NIN75799.1 hypothetical protein [Xanthomonadales bacterium]NIO12977.1 hypothetical protein [Xanthomonadales bacterium]NIP12839.1 hypothetical protein [Xanthomonadales bacterium]